MKQKKNEVERQDKATLNTDLGTVPTLLQETVQDVFVDACGRAAHDNTEGGHT